MCKIIENKKVVSNEVTPSNNDKPINLEITIHEVDDLLQLSVRGKANLTAMLKLFEFVSGALVKQYDGTPDKLKELVDYMFDKED